HRRRRLPLRPARTVGLRSTPGHHEQMSRSAIFISARMDNSLMIRHRPENRRNSIATSQIHFIPYPTAIDQLSPHTIRGTWGALVGPPGSWKINVLSRIVPTYLHGKPNP